MGLYNLCTISWLSFLGKLLQIVGVMRIRVLVLSGVVLVMSMTSTPASAEGKIQSYVNSYGKVVFTNVVENPPVPTPVAALPAAGVTEQVPDPLLTLVDTVSANHGVDPALVRAVIKTESNFDRWAVSSKGALGLMQLMPSTGRRYGVTDFFDPQQNINGGVRYLKFLLEKFNGNLDLSLAAYNAGENLVQRLGRIPSIPETMKYVSKIRAVYKPKSPPVTASAGPAAVMTAAATPEPPRIFKMVDERGVVHFSNIEPPN